MASPLFLLAKSVIRAQPYVSRGLSSHRFTTTAAAVTSSSSSSFFHPSTNSILGLPSVQNHHRHHFCLPVVAKPFSQIRHLSTSPFAYAAFDPSSSNPAELASSHNQISPQEDVILPTVQDDVHVAMAEDDQVVPLSDLLNQDIPQTPAGSILDFVNPVNWVIEALQVLHSTGVPWWVGITAVTVVSRLIFAPLTVRTMKLSTKLAEVTKLVGAKPRSPDPEIQAAHRQELWQAYKDHGVNPFQMMVPMFIQLPVFISFFLALKRLIIEDPSLIEGGILWFTNLTTTDDFFRFPIISGALLLANFEYNWKKTAEINGTPISILVKGFMRFFGAMALVITANFPMAIQLYWVASNFFTLLQTYVLNILSVRKRLGLPLPKNYQIVEEKPITVTGPTEYQRKSKK